MYWSTACRSPDNSAKVTCLEHCLFEAQPEEQGELPASSASLGPCLRTGRAPAPLLVWALHEKQRWADWPAELLNSNACQVSYCCGALPASSSAWCGLKLMWQQWRVDALSTASKRDLEWLTWCSTARPSVFKAGWLEPCPGRAVGSSAGPAVFLWTSLQKSSVVPSCCCRRQAFESYVAAIKKLEDAAQQEARASFKVGQAPYTVVVPPLEVVTVVQGIETSILLHRTCLSQGAGSRRAQHVLGCHIAACSSYTYCQCLPDCQSGAAFE